MSAKTTLMLCSILGNYFASLNIILSCLQGQKILIRNPVEDCRYLAGLVASHRIQARTNRKISVTGSCSRPQWKITQLSQFQGQSIVLQALLESIHRR